MAAPTVRDLVYKGHRIAGSARWAPVSMNQVKESYQTWGQRHAMSRYKDVRNTHELSTLSFIIDAIIDNRPDAALKVAIRRLYGVEQADGSNDWSVATALDITKPVRIGNDDLLRRVKKDAQLIKSASSAKSQPSPGNGGQWEGSAGSASASQSSKKKKKNKNKKMMMGRCCSSNCCYCCRHCCHTVRCKHLAACLDRSYCCCCSIGFDDVQPLLDSLHHLQL